MDELASSSNEHTDSSIRSGDPRSPCEEDTARSSERHKKHRREQKDKDRTRQHLKEREESSETSSPEKRERRRKEKEGGEEDARRHRRPRDSSTSSGEGSGSVHMSLRDSRERRKKLRGEHRSAERDASGRRIAPLSYAASLDSSEQSTSSGGADSGSKNPSPSRRGLRILASDGSASVDSPFYIHHRRPSSSLGRIPDESRENDSGLVSAKDSVSSVMPMARRRTRLGAGSLDTPHQYWNSDLSGFLREPPTAGGDSDTSASSPIGIGRISSENVPLRPQVKYTRRTAEGTDSNVDVTPRRPKIHKSGSGEWELRLRKVNENQPTQGAKSEPHSPVSPPLLETPTNRQNTEIDCGSPRHLGTLTELEVVDEDSNESVESNNEEGADGDKTRPKKRRISSCSSGAGKTLIVVKTTPPSQRRRGLSTSGSTPSLTLHLPLADNRPKVLPSKVYFLGKPGSGKSTLIQVMATGAFGVLDRYNKREKVVRVKLSRTDPQYVDVVDTTSPYEPYLLRPDPKCFVFLYSVTDTDSMKYTENLISLFLSIFSSGIPPPCLIVGTKTDLVPEAPRAVPLERGLAVAAGLRALHMEVSSRNNNNVASLKQLIYTTLQSPASSPKGKRPKSLPRSNLSMSSGGSSSSPPSPSSASTNPLAINLKAESSATLTLSKKPDLSRSFSSTSASSFSTSLSISESVSTDSVSDSISDSLSAEFKPPAISLMPSSAIRRISPPSLSFEASEIDATSSLSHRSSDVISVTSLPEPELVDAKKVDQKLVIQTNHGDNLETRRTDTSQAHIEPTIIITMEGKL